MFYSLGELQLFRFGCKIRIIDGYTVILVLFYRICPYPGSVVGRFEHVSEDG